MCVSDVNVCFNQMCVTGYERCDNQCAFQRWTFSFNQMCVSGCEWCNNQCAFQRWTFSFNQMCVSGCERFVIFNVRFSHIFSMLNQTLDNLSLRLFGQLIFSVNSLWIHLKQMRSIWSLLLLLPLTLSYAQLSNLRKSSGNYNCWIFLWQLFVKSWCYSLSNSYCIFLKSFIMLHIKSVSYFVEITAFNI